MKPLTPQEQRVFSFITDYFKDYKELPTHVAIGNHLGQSRQNATKIIASLVKKGVLKRAKRFGLYTLV